MGLQWAAQGFLVRLFMLYLVVIVCISLIRSARLVWRLYAFPGRKRISLQAIWDEAVSAEMFAQLALCNRVRWESKLEASKPVQSSQSAGRPAISSTLQIADSRFAYLWDMCFADVKSISRSMRLVLVLSSTLLIWNFFPTWNSEFNNANIPGFWALRNAIDLIFAWFGLALFVCSVLYALYSRFEVAMVRRKANWEYLRTTLETCDGSPEI